MAMHPEFVDLVQEFLTDGVISEAELNVLMKKADKLGIDRDEAYLYTQAQLQKLQQQIEAANMKKLGKLCPMCGKQVPDLANTCPHCDSPITAEICAELDEILENLEDALVELKSGRDFAASMANIDRYVRKAKRSFDNNPKVVRLLEEIAEESKAAEQKQELNEIINNLEEALVSFKSGKNVNEAKALVERYSRTARNKYGDNAKVAELLAGIEKEMKSAESKAKRQAVAGWFASHKKLVIVLSCIIVGILITVLPIIALEMEDDYYDESTLVSATTLSNEINDLLDENDLKGAVRKLENATIDRWDYEDYDPIYYKVLRALADADMRDDFESVAIAFKAKTSYYWQDTSCYTFAESKYESWGRDFSILEASY